MRASRRVCDGRSREKRSASRQIDAHLKVTANPGHASLLRATSLRVAVTAIASLSMCIPLLANAAKEYMPAPGMPELAHAVIFGDWNKGEQTGVVRYVQSAAGIQHSRSRAWVQWIEFSGTMGYDAKIVATKEIGLLKGNFGVSVPTPEFRNGKLVLYAFHTFEHCTFKLTLNAIDVGRVTATVTGEAMSPGIAICKIRNNKPVFD